MDNLTAIVLGIGIQTLVISLGLVEISNALHDIEAELKEMRAKRGNDKDKMEGGNNGYQ